MEIGYKALDKDCKVGFEVGKTYYIDKDSVVKELMEGEVIINTVINRLLGLIKYDEKLEDIVNYSRDNKIFKVEIIDKQLDKKGARVIKFLEEVSKEEIEVVREKMKLEKLEEAMNIDLVKSLQDNFPNLVIGGSVSLFLQGVRLNRFSNGNSDLDIILPYYELLEAEGITIEEEDSEDRPSGSDYSETLSINGVKADIRIDPKSKYIKVKYNDFTFKVVPLWIIIEAKAKYASTHWGEKHRDDLKELILNKK